MFIERTLVSADGVFSKPKLLGNLVAYRDDACHRDGLGILSSSTAAEGQSILLNAILDC